MENYATFLCSYNWFDYIHTYPDAGMNKENASKLWKIIQEAGDYLMCLRDTLVDLGSQ